VTYRYRLQDLFALLRPTSEWTEEAAAHQRAVKHGLVSVGLKIHCLDDGKQFARLVRDLGGRAEVLDINLYKDERASMCLVLPPVGSAGEAIHLIQCIEQFIGIGLFGNRRIQLQVCSPGRLSSRASALLAISFYLGSDTLRRYTQADLRTTFSSGFAHPRGVRLVLYDAEGDFDRDFTWWNEQGIVEPRLPFRNGRTDLLIGSGSTLDIQNINLIATLLIHSEYAGYWRSLGDQFRLEMESLLDRHLLAGLLAAPWIRESSAQIGDDDRFFAALQELVAYAYGEATRVKQPSLLWFGKWRDIPARPPNGILEEMQTLLSKYRNLITTQSALVAQGGEPA
jgi:hypothetical protein